MKKYISFLSLIAAIALQSCDRSDLVSSSENENLTKKEITVERSYGRSENIPETENSSDNKSGTGEDETPRKDKSHWRIQNDTVR